MSLNQDWKPRRNPSLGTLHSNFTNMHYSIASYHSDCYTDRKTDLKKVFPQEKLLDKLNMLENPLQKNLADSLPNLETKNIMYPNYEMSKSMENHNFSYATNSTLSGISNFISGVFNVITGVLPFQRGKTEYCREPVNASPPLVIWPTSNSEYLNKRLSVASIVNDKTKMSISEPTIDTALHLEDDVFEDAFTNVDKIDHKPKTKVHVDKVSTGCLNECLNDHVEPSRCIDNHLVCSETLETEYTPEIVASCEDKLNKLKALLSGKNKQKNMPEAASKKYKNPNKGTDKRVKPYLQKQIQEDMTFADEIYSDIEEVYLDTNSDDITDYCIPETQASVEKKTTETNDISAPEKDINDSTKSCFDEKMGRFRNTSTSSDFVECDIQSNVESQSSVTQKSSDKEFDCFDEVSGRFRNASNTESEDSFQIVFTDLTPSRTRKYSDCESEDSFIIFDENQDCYMSTDVFGEGVSDYDSSDSDECQMPSKFSRTVSDLTDFNLYDESDYKLNSDEIDCAAKICEELPVFEQPVDYKINKKVRFSDAPPTVHLMCVWSFAARQARAGNWERFALDRERFKRRIADIEMSISWVLKPQHRNRVKFQRFMPWWHLQRRLEAEQKKERERLAAIEKEKEEALEREREAAEIERKALEAEQGIVSVELDSESGVDEFVDSKVDSEETQVNVGDEDNSKNTDEKGNKVENCKETDVKVVKQGYLSRARPSPITTCSPKVFGKPFKKNNDKYGLKPLFITSGSVKQICAKVANVDQKCNKPKQDVIKPHKSTPKKNFYVEICQNKLINKINGVKKLSKDELNCQSNVDSSDSSHETDSESEKSDNSLNTKLVKDFVNNLQENGILVNGDNNIVSKNTDNEPDLNSKGCDNNVCKNSNENYIENRLPNGIVKHDLNKTENLIDGISIDITNNNIDTDNKKIGEKDVKSTPNKILENGLDVQDIDIEKYLTLKPLVTKPYSVSYQINFR